VTLRKKKKKRSRKKKKQKKKEKKKKKKKQKKTKKKKKKQKKKTKKKNKDPAEALEETKISCHLKNIPPSSLFQWSVPTLSSAQLECGQWLTFGVNMVFGTLSVDVSPTLS